MFVLFNLLELSIHNNGLISIVKGQRAEGRGQRAEGRGQRVGSRGQGGGDGILTQRRKGGGVGYAKDFRHLDLYRTPLLDI